MGSLAAWRKPANREPVRAVLDADGFSHTGPSGARPFVWGVASQARETAEAYYVYVPNGVSSLVYWLPKRAVPIDEHAAVRQQIQAFVGRYRVR
ncbi:YcxB family protein [Promicromonospora panici]|uniref:YcxB family protein n=1 Tax=Promicromonospora panici TaxID=2219658 RepID=UPI00101DFAF5|nr:YcxB family protein [Promicromonospora panici]